MMTARFARDHDSNPCQQQPLARWPDAHIPYRLAELRSIRWL